VKRTPSEPTGIDPDHLPTGDEKHRAVQQMFDNIAPRYDLVNRLMTFRLDVRWRRRAIRSLRLPAGSRILDLASGTGDMCIELFRQGFRPISADFSFGMLSADRRSTAPRVQADACRMPFPDGSTDGVTCGFALRNFVDLGAFFDDVARVTRHGGRVAFVDAAEPENPLLRWGHSLYFQRIVPRIGGLLSDRTAYRYLPKSLAYLPPPAEMLARLEQAGFVDAERRLLFGGAAQLVTATRS
jgi:demethylmenaquinone methyltransferase/2-methoxy-6-polyprenyl-1,4-benzoquinol methylase